MSGCHHVNLYSSIMFLFLYFRSKKRTIWASSTEKWALALAQLGFAEKKRLCTFSSNRQIPKWWRVASDSTQLRRKTCCEILLKHIFIVCVPLLKPYFLRIISPSSSSVTRFTGIRLLSVCGPPTHTFTHTHDMDTELAFRYNMVYISHSHLSHSLIHTFGLFFVAHTPTRTYSWPVHSVGIACTHQISR